MKTTDQTQRTSCAEQRALAAFEHVSRTGGSWGARLAAMKTGELLRGTLPTRTKHWRIH